MDDLVSRIYEQFFTRALRANESHLYVDLDEARGDVHVALRLERHIRLSKKHTCQVLAGHDGSGKSTELYRLRQNLETPDGNGRKYFAVFCEADRDVDRNDVDFPEVLIAIVRQLSEDLKLRAGVLLKPNYFIDRCQELMAVLGQKIEFEKFDVTVGFAKLSGTIKASPDTRLKLRRQLEPETENLIRAANDLIGQAILALVGRGYCGLTIIVDDLDKMILRPHEGAKCTTLEYLFIHRAAQLRAFDCHLVYTMPLELPYSSAEQTIESLYGKVEVVPMTKVVTKPPAGRAYEPGIDLFRRVIRQRLAAAQATEQDLFGGDDAVRDRLIELTGGQPTELMTLVREGLVTDDLPIRQNALDRIARHDRATFARQLRADHWPIIEQVRATGQVVRTRENDVAFRELIESRAILLYVNDGEWYALHPLVRELTPTPVAAVANR